jgi:hypothetical protein
MQKQTLLQQRGRRYQHCWDISRSRKKKLSTTSELAVG